jgi:small subunit ribosomal protein S19e
LGRLRQDRTPYLFCYAGNELAPFNDDWVYIKVASLARKIYLRPHTGVRLLSHIYGGLKRGNCASESHAATGTKTIRWGLQQLEKQKLIRKDKKGDGLKINSRVISSEGRRTLNRIATEYIKNRK